MHERRIVFHSSTDLRDSARLLTRGTPRVDRSFNLSDFGLMTPKAINQTYPMLEEGDIIVVHGETGNQRRHLTRFAAGTDPAVVVSHIADIYLTAEDAAHAPAPNTEVFLVPRGHTGLIERVPYADGVHFNICTHSEYDSMFNPHIPERRRSEANRLRHALGVIPLIYAAPILHAVHA